jgi:hypothetical protein
METLENFRADGVVWFRPPLEKLPCDIGLKDLGK